MKSRTYWQKVSDKIKERDNNQCVVCGSVVNIQVHHTKTSPGERYDNLVTLCYDCHTKTFGAVDTYPDFKDFLKAYMDDQNYSNKEVIPH